MSRWSHLARPPPPRCGAAPRRPLRDRGEL